MKASIKFREEKNPLMRAKVPISVLGLPLISGVAVGDAAELRLDLATAFDSGPSFRVSYRPTDPLSPFSFVLKTDVGPLGLPFAAAPLAMTAEFSPFGRGGAGAGPSFCVFFKPRFGDFSITKSVRSDEGTSENGINSNSNSNSGKKANGVFPADVRFGGVGGIGRLFSGMEFMARSVLPLWSGSGSQTALKLRWGLRVPPELRTLLTDDGRKAPMTRMSLSNLPFLVLNKISIERLMDKGKEKEKKKEKKKQKQKKASEAYTAPSDATAEVVSRHLEVLQAEHGTLWQSLEKLHAEIVDWKTAQSLEKLRAEFIDWNTAPVVAGRASAAAGNGEVSGEFCEVPGEFRR